MPKEYTNENTYCGICGRTDVPTNGGICKDCEPEWARQKLEELRKALRAESISYGELAELQSLAKYIEPGDVELLEAAGVPEFDEEK